MIAIAESVYFAPPLSLTAMLWCTYTVAVSLPTACTPPPTHLHNLDAGWLDVPKHAREGAFIVNCAISPLVSHNEW